MKRRSFESLAAIICLCGLPLSRAAHAVPIPIENSSFEEPVTGRAGTGFTPGWIRSDEITRLASGIWRPNVPSEFSLIPDGSQISAIKSGGGYMSQPLANTLTANTQYELSVYVGHFRNTPDPLPPFAVQLLAGNNLLAVSSSPIPTHGEFVETVTTYIADENDPLLGQTLEIRLVNTDPLSQFAFVHFDDVRLNAAVTIPTWNVDADGNWSVAANWSGRVPHSVGARAVFGGIINQPRTVMVDAPITVGRIDFDSTNGYAIAGTNSLTLDARSGNAQINATRGSHTIGAPVTLADDTVITVASAGGYLSLTDVLTANGKYLTKAGAGTLTLNNIRAASLAINDGTVAIAPNPGPTEMSTSALGTLLIWGTIDAWTAKLDLTNNDAVVHSIPAIKAADLARLRNQVKQGFNGGDWQGLGITSATAATNPTADTGITVVDNALLGYRDFSGQPVTADSILLKYTYYGDIDQNGQVDADDLTVFASNFGRTSGATQIDGDIDFNGMVNADDLTVFANNFNKGVGNPLATVSVAAASVQAVPEPDTLLLAALGAATMLAAVARRRRQRTAR